MSAPAPAPSAWVRADMGLVAAGFAISLIVKSLINLSARKLRGNDIVILVLTGFWTVYIAINVVCLWAAQTIGPITNSIYWTNSASILYTICVCAVLYLSIVRASVLLSFRSQSRRIFELVSFVIIVVIFAVRIARTVVLFNNIPAAGSTANPSLTQTATTLQAATLFPVLCLRIMLDISAIYKLWVYRIKVEQGTGSIRKEAFYVICISMLWEFILTIWALAVATQEQMQYTGDKFSFIDWLLISTCLSHWVEQRHLYIQIFAGSVTVSTGASRSNATTSVSEATITNTNTNPATTAKNGIIARFFGAWAEKDRSSSSDSESSVPLGRAVNSQHRAEDKW